METTLEVFNDIYTRKVGGEQYDYTVNYEPGRRVEWHAKVYQDGQLKGQPNGVINDNRLSGAALKKSIVALVECTIEIALEIAE